MGVPNVGLAAVEGRTADGRRPVFSRVILKLGGEAMLGNEGYGIDYTAARRIAEQITNIVERGVQVAIVVGGGNIVRGRKPRSTASTASPPTTWACSRRSSTRWHCATPSSNSASRAGCRAR